MESVHESKTTVNVGLIFHKTSTAEARRFILDELMSFSDASELWGLSESALRKAVSYGKIVPGVDARKYGKQWVVTCEAMTREYGEPVTGTMTARNAE